MDFAQQGHESASWQCWCRWPSRITTGGYGHFVIWLTGWNKNFQEHSSSELGWHRKLFTTTMRTQVRLLVYKCSRAQSWIHSSKQLPCPCLWSYGSTKKKKQTSEENFQKQRIQLILHTHVRGEFKSVRPVKFQFLKFKTCEIHNKGWFDCKECTGTHRLSSAIWKIKSENKNACQHWTRATFKQLSLTQQLSSEGWGQAWPTFAHRHGLYWLQLMQSYRRTPEWKR